MYIHKENNPTGIRTSPRNAKTLWGWNKVAFRINLGGYARILVIDAGLNALSDEEVLAFFDLAQVPVEVVPLALGLYRDTVARHSLGERNEEVTAR